MIRGVLFDLDRTLLDRDRSFSGFASAQFDRFQSRLPGLDRNSYVEALVRLDARGSVWKDQVYRRLVTQLGIESLGWQELFEDFEAEITSHYLPFPNLPASLAELARNYRFGLISNGRTDFQLRTIAALGIGEFFHVILISEAEGLRKPDPRIFHRALQRLELAPAEAVYVGDHPVTDVEAARNAGMLGIWKRNPDFSGGPSDGVIDELSELPALLTRLSAAAGPVR